MDVNIEWCFYIPLHNSESVDSSFGLKKSTKHCGPTVVWCTYIIEYPSNVHIYVFTRNSKWLFDFQTRIPCDTNHHWLFTIKSEDVYLRQWKLQIHRFTGEQSQQYNDFKKIDNSFQMLDRWSWQIQTFHRRSWRARGVKKTNWRW